MNPDDKPHSPQPHLPQADPAAEVIRAKIERLYSKEPDSKQEALEAIEAGRHRSKHQQYMHKLTTSGMALAEIQTAWHNYYINLPDDEKRDVWNEFYAEHGRNPQLGKKEPEDNEPARHHYKNPHEPKKPERKTSPRSVADVKKQLTDRIASRARLPRNQHLKAILFGMSMGCLVVVILLFGFFNERFIAPFITPSRSVSPTSIIIDPNSSVAGPNPEVVIPKINVEIPVQYPKSTSEAVIEKELESGVVHYASTPSPGEKGNVAIVGHSSNNIFNPGKYKFAFVLLSHLENGDTFSLSKNSKRYVYRVYAKKIVEPNDVSVLGPTDKPATATLITCDPPGTSLHRLVVIGEQIAPDPSGNTASTAIKSDTEPLTVPGNPISLWQRLVNWITR